jgi:hypothetical protein
MGTIRVLATALATAVFLLGLVGCAETFPGGMLNSRMFSGDLMEKKGSDGQIKRLSVTDLESWQRWHHNPIKGNGDNVIVKAEVTF